MERFKTPKNTNNRTPKPTKTPKTPKLPLKTDNEGDWKEPPFYPRTSTKPTTIYKEVINLTKLKHIFYNYQNYRDTIENEEKCMRRTKDKDGNTTNALFLIEKLIKACEIPAEFEGTEFGVIPVRYNKGRGCYNVGRWYSANGIGLQPLVSCVRHTICDGLWTDIDQVNSHPTILKILFDKFGFISTMLDECVNDRDTLLAKVDSDRDKAKTQIIAVINGGETRKLFLKKFKNDIKKGIDLIINHPDFEYIVKDVRKKYEEDKLKNPSIIQPNIEGKIIARILQEKENDLLQVYLEWAYGKGFIDDKSNNVSLIFDGFQLLSKFNITNEVLADCRAYALAKTGYDIELKIKKFDNKLELPDNYDDDTYREIQEKFLISIDKFVKDKYNQKYIYDVIADGGSNLITAKLSTLIFKGAIYYDAKRGKWYFCDKYNVWKESNNDNNFKLLNQLVLNKLFKIKYYETYEIYKELHEQKKTNDTQKDIEKKQKKELKDITFTDLSLPSSVSSPTNEIIGYDDEEEEIGVEFINDIDAVAVADADADEEADDEDADDEADDEDADDEADDEDADEDIGEKLKKITEKLKNLKKIIAKLQDFPTIGKMVENSKELFSKEDFYETYLDSKTHLFSFNNKVYDFKLNKIRLIKPDDYIMTTTGYNYPENIEDKDIKIVENYFNLLFNDKEMYNYILNSCCKTLNGDGKEQYFNIHTGTGSNGKTSFSRAFQEVMGYYFVNIRSATFTKPERNANETGDLYKAKGKRGVFVNEVNEEDKLQTDKLKLCADGFESFISVRQLYQDPIDIKVSFLINFFCNNKPDLSSCDGGIARRLRVIDWDKKFVDNPDPNNPNQILKDEAMMRKLMSKTFRNAFVILLLKRWETNEDNIQTKEIPVPQKIKDASASYIDDNNPVLGFLMEKYEITKNKTDFITTTNLLADFNNGRSPLDRIDAKKLKSSIENANLDIKYGRNDKQARCFLFIKKKDDEDDDDDA